MAASSVARCSSTSWSSPSGQPADGERGQAGLGGDREPGRDVQAHVGHLGEVGALAAEQVLHVPVALGEVVDVLGHGVASRPLVFAVPNQSIEAANARPSAVRTPRAGPDGPSPRERVSNVTCSSKSPREYVRPNRTTEVGDAGTARGSGGGPDRGSDRGAGAGDRPRAGRVGRATPGRASGRTPRSGPTSTATGSPTSRCGAPSAQPSGAVSIVYGSQGGLVADNMDTLAPQSGDPGQAFGNGLASADFNRDGFAELAVGSPGVTVAGATRAAGSPCCSAPPGAAERQSAVLRARTPPAYPEPRARTTTSARRTSPGTSTATATPIWRSGPRSRRSTGRQRRIVDVLPGAPGRARPAPGASCSASTPGDRGRAAVRASSGSAAAGNLGRGPEADLVIGAQSDTVGGVPNMGSAHVLFGSPNGLTTAHGQRWTGVSAGQPGGAGQFGVAVAIGNVGEVGGERPRDRCAVREGHRGSSPVRRSSCTAPTPVRSRPAAPGSPRRRRECRPYPTSG